MSRRLLCAADVLSYWSFKSLIILYFRVAVKVTVFCDVKLTG